MKGLRDGSGVVFDIRSDHLDRFMDNFDRIKETQNIDFEITKCTDLPDLEDDPGYGGSGGNWRDQGRGGGGYGGRGGGGYGGRGGGGYDRQGGNDWGRNNDRGYGGGRGGGGGGNDWGNKGSYGGDRGYDNNNSDSYGGGGGNWRDQNNSSRGGGGFEKRGGYQQRNDNHQGPMGFSSNAGDFRPKTSGPSAGHAPMIGNKVSRAKTTNSNQVVYVSNLRFQVNEQQLMDFFKSNKFDPVRARLLYDAEGNSKGYGFVEMANENDADDVVAKLNNQMFDGRKVNISIKN